MARHARRPRRARCRTKPHLHHHQLLYDHLVTAHRAPGPQARHRQAHRTFGWPHRCGDPRLLYNERVLAALPHRHSLWSRRGCHRFRPQQLRCSALRRTPHELATLLLGCRRERGPARYGLGPSQPLELAWRIPRYRPHPGRNHGGPVPLTSSVEINRRGGDRCKWGHGDRTRL